MVSSTAATSQITSQIMSGDERTIRDKIVQVAKQETDRLKNDFVYLSPDLRNSTGCKKEFFNGNMCTTANKEKCIGTSTTCTKYGTDCNGYVAYILHKALGITASDYRFAAPDKTNGYWYPLDEGKNYYKKVEVVDNALNNISRITQIAKPGDMVGRICPKSDGTYDGNHIGIYIGDGKVVDNSGSLTVRDLDKFATRTVNGTKITNCNVTIMQLYNFDTSTYK